MKAVIQSMPQMQRRIRSPKHPYQVRTQPFGIYPFFIAPVLPGETLKNLLLQARVVTDPIVNPLIGWHNEYYFFYVKLRDLDDRDEFTAMMVDPDWTPASIKSETAVPVNYFFGQFGENWVDYVQRCLERVTYCYFRNEDEAWDDHMIEATIPAAKLPGNSWLDSVVNDTAYAAAPDVEVSTAGDDAFTMSELERAMTQYAHLRASGLVQQTFEEFVKTYGVNLPDPEEPHKPELVRYVKDWSYPSNTIDPSDGSPSSAVSWVVAERADKDRRFKEMGFLFGVTVKRPKVYLSNQKGTLTAAMNGVLDWLPPMMQHQAHASMKSFDAGKGPLGANTDGYWVDMRDLLLYGEQFVNFAVTETDAGMVALPTAALVKHYPTAAMVDDLFVTPASAKYIREDGVVHIDVASVQRDGTPQVT